MRKLSVFNLVTLDGYFSGQGGDISWHRVDPEFQAYAEKNSNSGNTLLFGRVTYELMASYWPSPEAHKGRSRSSPRTSPTISSFTTPVLFQSAFFSVREKTIFGERKLKQPSGRDLTILGSGSIVTQLAQAGLIDEYQILLNPVILGKGTMFEGLEGQPSKKPWGGCWI
jgi:dihydrofolate reductase